MPSEYPSNFVYPLDRCIRGLTTTIFRNSLVIKHFSHTTVPNGMAHASQETQYLVRFIRHFSFLRFNYASRILICTPLLCSII